MSENYIFERRLVIKCHTNWKLRPSCQAAMSKPAVSKHPPLANMKFLVLGFGFRV
jgi:hypothetical protein